MTMPHLMNCEHMEDGWCLDCVAAQHAEIERLRAVLADAYKVLDGNVVLLLRAIRADATGGRYSYIQARDGAMLEATGPINVTNGMREKVRMALGA